MMNLTASKVDLLKSELRPYEVEYYGAEAATAQLDAWERTDAGTDICGAIKLSINGRVVLKTHIPAQAAESDDALRTWATAAKRRAQAPTARTPPQHPH